MLLPQCRRPDGRRYSGPVLQTSELAMVLRKLATPENKAAQFRRVIDEYEEADRHFKLAHNAVFRAHVKNNIGNVLRELSRFKEAAAALAKINKPNGLLRQKWRCFIKQSKNKFFLTS